MSKSSDPGSGLRPLRKGKPWELSFAYAYLVGLVLLVIGSFAGGVWLGILDIQATFTVQANLGWVMEYLAAGLLAVFLLFTFVQVVRITGIGFIRGVMRTIARIAHNYELPQPPESEEDQES